MNNLMKQAQAAVKSEKVVDQTKDTGGFDYEPPAAGPAMARLVSYVELGKRKQKPYQGKEKPDCYEARLVFELFGKKYAKEVEVGGTTKTVFPTIAIKIQIKSGDRANFTKLLKAMTYGRSGITHMALMLGEAFLVKVVHNVVGEGKDQKTYANLKDDGGWTISAPVKADPVTGESEPLPVPQPTKPLQLLLWDSPTFEQWDSIFIDGERTVKDDKGVETTKSNNWLQDDIKDNASDFEGSALHIMLLSGAGMELDGGQAKSEAAEAVSEEAVQSPQEDDKPSEEAPVVDDDPLADLDL